MVLVSERNANQKKIKWRKKSIKIQTPHYVNVKIHFLRIGFWQHVYFVATKGQK